MHNEKNYYSQKLSASHLKRCYDIASPRIQRYLAAEIQFVVKHLQPSDVVLELGCGYGRVLKPLAHKTRLVYGIDTSQASLDFAREYLVDVKNVKLFKMNAKALTFPDQMFDAVIAIQNGISAFKVEPELLVKESLRVTKHNGRLFFSSYSDKIWKARLEWFVRQAKEGLLGEIDFEKTHPGLIVCKDGFQASTFSASDFQQLTEKLGLEAIIEEVDNSSIFCVITAKHH